MIEVRGEDLGIADCDFVAQGEDAKTVVDQMVAHLEDEHDIDMPDAEVILGDYPDIPNLIKTLERVFSGEPDEETQMVVRRLREALDIHTMGDASVGTGQATRL